MAAKPAGIRIRGTTKLGGFKVDKRPSTCLTACHSHSTLINPINMIGSHAAVVLPLQGDLNTSTGTTSYSGYLRKDFYVNSPVSMQRVMVGKLGMVGNLSCRATSSVLIVRIPITDLILLRSDLTPLRRVPCYCFLDPLLL